MNEVTPKPVVVSENAGIIDTLTALGRMLLLIVTTVPAAIAVIGTRDLTAIIEYFQNGPGATLASTVLLFGTMAWGLWKTHRRGAQVASVAADTRVSNAVARLK